MPKLDCKRHRPLPHSKGMTTSARFSCNKKALGREYP